MRHWNDRKYKELKALNESERGIFGKEQIA